MINIADLDSSSSMGELIDRFLRCGYRKVLLCGEEVASDLRRLNAQCASTLALCHASCDAQFLAQNRDCENLSSAVKRQFDAIVVTASSKRDSMLNCIGSYADPTVEVAIGGNRARRPIAVSLPKSGTHLLSKALQLFGYQIYGAAGTFVPRSLSQTVALLRILERLGQNIPCLAGTDMRVLMRTLGSRSGLESDLKRVPLDLAFMIHNMPLDRLDQRFFRSWCSDGEPKVIFNYRDPRAVICSYVRFLMRDHLHPLPDQLAHSEILKAKSAHADRLMHAITDRTFPSRSVFLESTWLLQHPRVLKIRYEDLVGERGGGCESRQHRAVFQLLLHLQCPGDVRDIAARLYDPAAATFDRGTIDSWRDEFSAEHYDVFEEHFGQLLLAYGY
jgi:hypothetical protein